MEKISANFEGSKVLVADDYPVNQELFKDMLELMGCNVEVAVDGQDAFDKFSNNTYDLVLLDILMPKLDGYEVAKKIRDSEDKDKRIPLIAITANALDGDKEKCLNVGMDDYISKPIKSIDLQNKLLQFLEDKNA